MPNCPYCSKSIWSVFQRYKNHSAFCAIRHQGKYAAKNSTDELDIPPLRGHVYCIAETSIRK